MQMDLQDEKIKSLLHYMKGIEPFSKTLNELARTRRQWCPFTHKGIGVEPNCYRVDPAVQSVIQYIERYALCCRYLDCHPFSVQEIENACRELNVPERMTSVSDFEDCLRQVKDTFPLVEDDISDKLRRFTCFECQRLDEAIDCLKNYCFYSCVIMAVSAVEARIIEIVRRHDKSLYDSHFAKATLGQLVQLFDDNHYTEARFADLKKLMPDKHKPLVILLNKYRIFSAHPKAETITLQIAEAILKLAFTFMLDPATCPYKDKELKCGRPSRKK